MLSMILIHILIHIYRKMLLGGGEDDDDDDDDVLEVGRRIRVKSAALAARTTTASRRGDVRKILGQRSLS